MLRTILAAGLATSLALPATAQQAGRYDVQGSAAGGQAYRGTAELQPTGPDTWRITWRIANDTGQGFGLVLPDRRTLAIGYVFGGQTGAIAYSIEADGSLRGIWTMGPGGGVGTEVLTPTGGPARK